MMARRTAPYLARTALLCLAAISSTAAQDPAAAFDAWRAAHHASRPADVTAGVAAARARAAVMRALIERDPAEFVRRALPDAERAQLPAVVREHVEHRVRGRGFFGVMCVLPTDDHAGCQEHCQHGIHREVVLGGKRYRAFVFGPWLNQTTVADVEIDGVALDDAIALGDKPAPGELPVSVLGLPNKTGPNQVLYMIARFSDETTDPLTYTTATNRMQVTSEFFRNNSSGTVWLTGRVDQAVMDVTFITLPQPTTYASNYNSNFSLLLTHARNAAASNGFNYTDYNLDVVVTSNPNNSFTYAGRAYVGSQGAHLRYDYTTLRTAGHELGHNLGLWHANYWRTDATRPFGRDSVPVGYVSDSTNHEWVEYGHYFSVMSAQSFTAMNDATKPHFAAAEKNLLGWLSGSAVRYASSNGTYRLFRHDHRDATNTPRAIRIETAATDYTGYARRYWLNYRYVDFDTSARDWIRNGIQVDVARTSYGSDGAIQLDMTPFTMDTTNYINQASKPSGYWTIDNNDKRDGTLLVGRTYSDPAAGIHITPIATGNLGTNHEYIDVVINLGSFPSNRPPIIHSFTASTNQVSTGQNVTFTVNATDPDGDELAYAWDFDQTQVFTASGLNTNLAFKNWPAAGQYRVLATVSDRKGGVATAATIVTVGAPTANRQIWGRALWAGVPISNALVSVGLTNVWTGADGTYTLTDLNATSYTITGRCDGLLLVPQFTNPVSVVAGHAYGKDFWATNAVTGRANSTMSITPYQIYVTAGDTAQFTAQAWAANGAPLTNNPSWSVTGGGWIDAAGLFTALTDGGPYSVVASDGALAATGFVWVTGNVSLPTVTVAASDLTADEWSADSGAFVFQRTGSPAVSLAVNIELAGTASNGVDFSFISSPVIIPAGQSQTTVIVSPLADDLAESDETVMLTVLPSATYEVGAASNATVTIRDRPADDWRYSRFTAVERADPTISGWSADPDGDGLANLLEYAFGFEPKDAASGMLPTATPQDGYLTLTYRENKAATDVSFVVEGASELGAWDSTGLVEISRQDRGAYWEVTVRDAVPINAAPHRFLRVRVTTR